MALNLAQGVLVRNLGRLSYSKCIDVQKVLHDKVGEGRNTLLLVEHSSPVFTLGLKELQSEGFIRSKVEHLGIDVQRVSKRSEGIVWHGPGQITVYPIINEKPTKELITSMSNVIQKTLLALGIQCTVDHNGVMVGKEKIGDFSLFTKILYKC
eukprot:gene9182-10774_t